LIKPANTIDVDEEKYDQKIFKVQDAPHFWTPRKHYGYLFLKLETSIQIGRLVLCFISLRF